MPEIVKPDSRYDSRIAYRLVMATVQCYSEADSRPTCEERDTSLSRSSVAALKPRLPIPSAGYCVVGGEESFMRRRAEVRESELGVETCRVMFDPLSDSAALSAIQVGLVTCSGRWSAARFRANGGLQ